MRPSAGTGPKRAARGAEAFLLGDLGVRRRDDGAQGGVGLVQAGAGVQPAQHQQPRPVVEHRVVGSGDHGVLGYGDPQVGGAAARTHPAELLGGHADHGVALLVQQDRAADDPLVRREQVSPHLVAEDREGMLAGGGFLGVVEVAALCGGHPQHSEEVGGDVVGEHALDAVVDLQTRHPRFVPGQLAERRVGLAHRLEQWIGPLLLFLPALAEQHLDHALRIHAGNRRRAIAWTMANSAVPAPTPSAQRDHGDQAERLGPGQAAQREAGVREQVGEPSDHRHLAGSKQQAMCHRVGGDGPASSRPECPIPGFPLPAVEHYGSKKARVPPGFFLVRILVYPGLEDTVDVPRKAVAKRRRIRRAIYAGALVLVVGAVSIALSRLEPAMPDVDRSLVWRDKVKRGSMIREVRGAGVLVPERMLWIPAPSEGRLERILVQPGTPVSAETILLELTNPELELAALDAESQLSAAESELNSLRIRLQSESLTLQAAAVAVEAEHNQAVLQAQADEELARDGLVAQLTLELSRVREQELERRVALERGAHLDQHRVHPRPARGAGGAGRAAARGRRVASQSGRPVERTGGGRRSAAAAARRGRPVGHPGDDPCDGRRFDEAQGRGAHPRDPGPGCGHRAVGLGGHAQRRDSRRVARIDPSVQNGTVTVDVALEGELPRGARPDLSVDGTIELERLDNVLYVGRPAFGAEDSTIWSVPCRARRQRGRAGPGEAGPQLGDHGRGVEGLAEGDEVILSEMSNWDEYDRVRLD